jgi:hypothetical protein
LAKTIKYVEILDAKTNILYEKMRPNHALKIHFLNQNESVALNRNMFALYIKKESVTTASIELKNNTFTFMKSA